MDNKPAQENWQAQAERSNAFMIRLLATLALVCGRRFIQLLLYPVVFYFFLTGRQAKSSSRDALSRFTGESSKGKSIFMHLYYFAMVAVDRIFLVANKVSQYDVRFFGEELFEPLRASNKYQWPWQKNRVHQLRKFLQYISFFQA